MTLRLLYRFFTLQLGADETSPAMMYSDAQKEEILQGAEHELMDLQQLLGVMHKQGFKGSKEYVELVTLYAQLSRSITEAVKGSGLLTSLAAATTTSAQSRATTAAQNVPKRNKESIGKELPRFKSSLGPANMRGVTSAGAEVETLQKVLNWERLSVNIDAMYSPETMVAVRGLQKKYGIQPTGLVGSDTRKLLNILIGKE